MDLKSFFLFFVITVFAFSCTHKNENKITIATAANMQYAMKALTKEFTQNTSVDCDLIIGSSGKLTAQIMEGAPYDLFISADMKYPHSVYEGGLATDAPEIYASGRLVLWTMHDDLQPTLDRLSEPAIEHIALANPKTAPYGVAAYEALQNANLWKQLQDKLVYGESIGQTNQFIISQSAQVGFTSLSTVLAPNMKGKGKWVEIDTLMYSPVHQGAILIKRDAGKSANAQKFYNFLFSKEAQSILEDYGYWVK